jgi:hypothetical protein
VTNPDEVKMYGHSRIDDDQNLTVAGDLAALVDAGNTFSTVALLDVASTKTLDVNGELRVDAVAGTSQLEKLGTGVLTPDTIAVKGGDAAGEAATFLISNGNVTVSGTTPVTSVEAAHTVDADATLQFNGSGDTFDPGELDLLGGNPSSGGLALFDYDLGTLTNPDALNMYGLSKIDTEQSFTVTGDFTVTVHGSDTSLLRPRSTSRSRRPSPPPRSSLATTTIRAS